MYLSTGIWRHIWLLRPWEALKATKKKAMASQTTYETKTTKKQIRRVKVTKTVQKTLPDVRKNIHFLQPLKSEIYVL